MKLLGRLPHLVRRFFGFLVAPPLGPVDQAFVGRHLGREPAFLFWDQQVSDQRHAVDMARRVSATLPGDQGAIRAALLHDVGKRHSALGALGRSLATLLDGFSLPMSARMRAYGLHGPLGADDLEAAGCGDLEISFARHHGGAMPASVEPTRWRALLDADG